MHTYLNFRSGRTINSGIFASVCEIATVLNDAHENEYLKKMLEEGIINGVITIIT